MEAKDKCLISPLVKAHSFSTTKFTQVFYSFLYQTAMLVVKGSGDVVPRSVGFPSQAEGEVQLCLFFSCAEEYFSSFISSLRIRSKKCYSKRN